MGGADAAEAPVAKAKGTTMVGLVRFLRRHREAARAALPPALHGYLEERVNPAGWYPEEHLLGLVRAVATMLPRELGDPYRRMGELSAREHLDGSYAHLFASTTDPLAIPARAFALWASQHDSGRLDLAVSGEREAVVTLRDFAKPSREMCGIVGGYLAETLRLLGFADVHAEETGCRVHGDPACTWRCGWGAVSAATAGPASDG